MDHLLMQHAEHAIAQADPTLGNLIQRQRLTPRAERADYFAALCRSIIGQQVSVAAAAAIYARFETATALSPAIIANLSADDLRPVGLSHQKAGYLQDLARHFANDPSIYNHLERQTDEQVIAELTAVKGIGEWTAQMFLMFTLARSDVFAPDDAGLQRAMAQLYHWQSLPARAERIRIADAWRPYRTVACLHLWQSLDNEPSIAPAM
ncbi:MAG: DNA-3-methyladenine glycosylase family protein [Candidatus Micrarchaeaceae archaeon]